MARERTKIKKIDNLTVRQVIFSKRRRELIKKARELSVLCDADVTVIIFSATGKFYDFSSSSMEDTLTRYVLHSNNIGKTVQPCLELQTENYNHKMLQKEVSDEFHIPWQMDVEYLEWLNIEELGQLKKKLEAGLRLVIKTEEERALNEINKLQRKEALLIKENKQLKQKMMILHRGESVTVNSVGDNTVPEAEGILLESVNNVSIISNSVSPVDDDRSDPSS